MHDTLELIPEAQWRDETLFQLIETELLGLSQAFAKKLEPTGLTTLGAFHDHLQAGRDFSGVDGFESAAAVARMELKKMASERNLENFMNNGEPVESDGSESDAVEGKPDSSEETAPSAEAGSASAIDELRREVDELRKQIQLRNNEHEHYMEIQNKRLYVAGLKAEWESDKEQAKNSKKRYEAGVDELDTLIANSPSPQMQLPFEPPAPEGETVSEDTPPAIPQSLEPTAEGAAPLPAEGWTVENYRNAPLIELELTDNQQQATEALGVKLIGELEIEISKEPCRVQKRVITKYQKWLDLHNIVPGEPQPDDAFTGDQRETDAENSPGSSVIPYPGKAKRIQLTKNYGDDAEETGLTEDSEHAVLRSMGDHPVVAGGEKDVCLLESGAYEVLETWPE